MQARDSPSSLLSLSVCACVCSCVHQGSSPINLLSLLPPLIIIGMRTRSQSSGRESTERLHHVSETIDDTGTLSNTSRDAVGKLLRRVNKGFDKQDVAYLRHSDDSAAAPKMEIRAKDNRQICKNTGGGGNDESDADPCGGEPMQYASVEKDESGDDYDFEWEDGHIPTLSPVRDVPEELVNGVSVEFDILPGVATRKPVRRATAEEKEVAEIVHKSHLLCLLGRGRLIDSACNDPLIQASLLSLLPTHLLKVAEVARLTAGHLGPLVSWFHSNFHVRTSKVSEKSCHLALASALETREGTPEEVAALSVALFRALNLTARFVSILDVVSLKPEADKSESNMEVVSTGEGDLFSSSTLMVAGPSCSSSSASKSSTAIGQGSSNTVVRGTRREETNKTRKHVLQPQDSLSTNKAKEKILGMSALHDTSEQCLVKSDGLKRKGDLEFQMQLEMAVSATAVENSKKTVGSNALDSCTSSSNILPPFKKMKKIKTEDPQTSLNGISVAIGSKKVGAPLYWSEVFCNGENLTGRWLHVDAVNAIIDGEHKVEAAAAACKKTLRYVIAFAGYGAKDVTRRYCTKWYKVASKRVNSAWWDAVLAPLKKLESGATDGGANLQQEVSGNEKVDSSELANLSQRCILHTNNSYTASEDCRHKNAASSRNSFASNRSTLEDMELETRALTEPLPTNQQAYRNHHLYVIERWLKKYEILYPKMPVLGYCSGHAVYPRTCVQTLRIKEKWLREGLQVRAGEVPAKVLKSSDNRSKEEAENDNDSAYSGHEGATALYGKWQTEPLCLPRAVNGIVPKNERGRVDVWSEKCLPPGTVHLRLPRVAPVAKRLDIDFAHAMVGFEFRNGRSFPLFEGIVVCSEFKDAIVEAYAEEEEKRQSEEKRRNETKALTRWYQLLSSIVTRQRLNECYGEGRAISQEPTTENLKSDDKCSRTATAGTTQSDSSPGCQHEKTTLEKHVTRPSVPDLDENHEHEFRMDDDVCDEGGTVTVKRCRCGFSVQFEEL